MKLLPVSYSLSRIMWSWKCYTWHTLMSSYHWLDFSCWPADMVLQYDSAVSDVFSVSIITKTVFQLLSFLQVLCSCICLDVPWPDSSSIRICVAVIPVSPVSCASICLKWFHFCRLYAIVLCSHVVLWPGWSSVRSCVAVMPASPVSCDSIWFHQPDQTQLCSLLFCGR